MLDFYNKNELLPENKRIPEDLFNGDGVNYVFALFNITPEILSRVYVEEILLGTSTDFFTYFDSGTNWINFYEIPLLGTNNIVCQSNTGLFFPGGTQLSGEMNGYIGETKDYEFAISNNDPLMGYTEIDIIPVDEIGSGENAMIKLATTQGGLDSAVGGSTLRLSDITDYDTLHTFWIRITIPSRYLTADIPRYNKYDLSLAINALEYTL